MIMLFSFVFYLSLLLFCGIFAWMADRRSSKLFLWLIILSLSLVAGFRAYSVGIDTQRYVDKFSYIYRGMFRYAYGFEESFKYICYVVLHIVPNASFLLGLLSFITNAAIILRFWEYRKLSSFPCMVVFYYMSFYFMSLNGVRQFVAVAIVFWGTRYLGQKKFFSFIVCICIASLFHHTAILALFLLLLNLFQWKDLYRSQKQLFILFALCLPLIVVLLSNNLNQYSRYFAIRSFNIGMIIPVKLILWMLCLFLTAHSFRYQDFLFGIDNASRFNIQISYINYLIGLILAALVYFFPTFIERISWYFYVYEGVFYGALLKNTDKETRTPLAFIICFLIGYAFLYSMVHNSQGTMPYLFV